MNKYFLLSFLSLILCVVACNTPKTKSSWELAEEERIQEQERIDSINLSIHKRIDDSLSLNDKGHIIDNIYLGMSKNDFDKEFKELKSKVSNKIDINGVAFWLNDLLMDFGKDNKLHVFSLEKTYVVNISINEKDMSKTSVYDEGTEIRKNLYQHFSDKYGEPAILKNGKPCHINDADIISWVFSTRRIDIIKDRVNHIYINISETPYYNRKKEINDSIENVYQQSLRKKEQTQKEYGSQL